MLGLNKKSLLCLFTCLLFLLTSFAWNNTSIIPAAGGINALVVDQQQTTYDVGVNLITTHNWQSFTPSVDGIAGVSIYAFNDHTEDPTGRYLSIAVDDASDGSTPLASDTVDISGLTHKTGAWINITFTTVSITISSTYYILVADPSYTTPDDPIMWLATMSDTYSGGTYEGAPNIDATFKTYYDDVVTPEFDTFMLLLVFTQLGLLVMVIYLVRKR